MREREEELAEGRPAATTAPGAATTAKADRRRRGPAATPAADASTGNRWRDERRGSARPRTSCSSGRAAAAVTTSLLRRPTLTVRAARTSSSAGQRRRGGRVRWRDCDADEEKRLQWRRRRGTEAAPTSSNDGDGGSDVGVAAR
ncbi:hypothetical protein Scep_026460 [Stephania cephalantha]|uniref:Uncharacterized protein n=1 Tax=Stephania cephalantha TaxID=152367 RepID=A0AAP0EK80_9MAGN